MSIITSQKKDDTLYLYAQWKIDSVNAPQAEAEINEQIKIPHSNLVLDVTDLTYISSAGLRIILRLKKTEPTLCIINASNEVYEIFDMTGFTEMIDVSKAYRNLSVEGCKIIGKGAKGAVYRLDADTIVKVYFNSDSLPDIQRERELARRAFILGIPTAISYDVVKVGDKYGSVFELLDAKSFSQLVAEEPENFDKYVKLHTELLKLIHSTKVNPDDMPDIKKLIYNWISVASAFIKPEETEKLKSLVEKTPDTMNMLHCDYHLNNIMYQNGETILIDMDTLSHGHPIFELANIYITYVGFGETDNKVVESFIGLPYETAVRIWDTFLPQYLETDDKAYIENVENKAKLLCYVRLLRHVARRGINNDTDRKNIELCTHNITELLAKVDSLDF